MEVFLVLLATLIAFTWPLWIWWLLSYPKQKIITGQKGLDSPDTDNKREVIAKETYIWEVRRVTRERSIYAESK